MRMSSGCLQKGYKQCKIKLTVPPKKVAVAYETWLFSRVCDCSDWKNVGVLNYEVQER